MSELKVIKKVEKNKTYIDKNGKERIVVDYYLSFNDVWVPIKPCFSKGYSQLDLIAQTIINGKQE